MARYQVRMELICEVMAEVEADSALEAAYAAQEMTLENAETLRSRMMVVDCVPVERPRRRTSGKS